MAELLKNWSLFESIEIEEALYPGELAYEKRNSYDAVIYTKLPGSGMIGIYLVTPHSTKETILFTENTTPQNEAGYRFFLNNIKKAMEKDDADFKHDKFDMLKLEENMKNERRSDIIKQEEIRKRDEEDARVDEPDEVHDSPMPTSMNNFVMINPFAYDDLNDDSFGHNTTIAVLNFPDGRQNTKGNDTLIGTLYGAVYHNPLLRIHSEQPVNLVIMNIMETLFIANRFQVNKYPNISNVSQLPNGRLAIKGKVNKL